MASAIYNIYEARPSDGNPECTICHEMMTDSPSPDRSPRTAHLIDKNTRAYHIYCIKCITEWTKQGGECPSCRQPFDLISTEPVKFLPVSPIFLQEIKMHQVCDEMQKRLKQVTDDTPSSSSNFQSALQSVKKAQEAAHNVMHSLHPNYYNTKPAQEAIENGQKLLQKAPYDVQRALGKNGVALSITKHHNAELKNSLNTPSLKQPLESLKTARALAEKSASQVTTLLRHVNDVSHLKKVAKAVEKWKREVQKTANAHLEIFPKVIPHLSKISKKSSEKALATWEEVIEKEIHQNSLQKKGLISRFFSFCSSLIHTIWRGISLIWDYAVMTPIRFLFYPFFSA